jgi:hypothetical protein
MGQLNNNDHVEDKKAKPAKGKSTRQQNENKKSLSNHAHYCL